MKQYLLHTIWLSFFCFSFTATNAQWVYAGPDQTIFAGQTAQLNGSGAPGTRPLWKTNGSGSFSNKFIFNPVYTPSAADIIKGKITLTLSDRNNPGIADKMILKIRSCPTVNIPAASDTICGSDFGGYYDISAVVTGTGYSVLWTTSGTGFFFDETNPVTSYEYTPSDAGNGNVWLYVTVTPDNINCPPARDSFFLRLNDPARIDLSDFGIQTCSRDRVFVDGNISGTATTVFWSGPGGNFVPNPGRDTYYYPTTNDLLMGYADISGVTNDPPGPCPAASDVTYIEFFGGYADAGPDLTICASPWGGSFPVNVTVAGGSGFVSWSTNGYGWFDDEFDPNTFYNFDASDVGLANIEIYATVSGQCDNYTDTIKVWLQEAPWLQFPNPFVFGCSNSPVNAEVYLYGYASSGTWNSTGSGTFSDPTSTYSLYYPSPDDIINGCVDLYFTTNDPKGPCGPVSDYMTACFFECFAGEKPSTKEYQRAATPNIRLYPNPAQSIINIQYSGIIQKNKCTISDATGRRYPCNWSGNNTLNINSLAAGSYFLRLSTEKGDYTMRFIVSR